MHAIEASNIVMEFPGGEGPVRVLHGVDLTLEAGALAMLVGPSGCGKTTLLSILSGTLSATAGRVDVLGTNITSLGDADLVRFRRRNIGFIFQQYNLLPSLSCADNAAVALIADGVPPAQARALAADTLAILGMAPHIGKLPRQLSGGQQQRVAIARALVHNPRLIVCDEPTAALDAGTGHTVMELLRTAAADAQRCVLVVTHDNRIFDFADRIVEMEDGRIRAPATLAA
jgi:putative ABC transport system ATP-binding protein